MYLCISYVMYIIIEMIVMLPFVHLVYGVDTSCRYLLQHVQPKFLSQSGCAWKSIPLM
jgi:hypothetical protein